LQRKDCIPRYPIHTRTAVQINTKINNINNMSASKYTQDGEAAKEIAQYLPYFPFKGIPRFYDIGGFLYAPEIFQKIVDIFVERYRDMEIDVIAG
jgi:hypothetical protein